MDYGKKCTLLIHTWSIIAQIYLAATAKSKVQILRQPEDWLVGNNSFPIFWNVPTQTCKKEYGINVDVVKYGILSNKKDGWAGEHVTLLPHMGLYPRISESGAIINGGVPQNSNISLHLTAVEKEIQGEIPDPNFHGLAIIDYEAWRPLWERNFDEKEIYQHYSINLVQKRHPTWTREKVLLKAEEEFESSARYFMEATLNRSRSLRPRGRWGYYLFPECYNYKGETNCSERTVKLNDRLLWLFQTSSALFPSGYIHSSDNITRNQKFVHGQVNEGLRIKKILSNQGLFLPVFLYSRFRYANGQFYKLEDLQNSIGQALTLGADGVVLWDDHTLSQTLQECESVKTYVDSILGPYVTSLIDSF